MQFTPALRKATELGIGLAAIATLILAGCGGSKSSSNNNSTVTPTAAVTIKVTPGKGIMTGASVVIKNASGVQVGTGTTTAAGIASVTLDQNAVGPFVVTVNCPAGCQYFDEKNMVLVNGAATTPPLLAVVANAGNTDIGVTAATHAAAQYALATSAPLTATSVTVANDAVIAALGFPAGTNILTPPTIIKDAATLAAAQAGTTAADTLAKFSAGVAIAASGVTALDAINSYGTAWATAAVNPASGVIMPSSINQTTLQAAAPTLTIPPTLNVASAVAAATTATATAVADVSAYLTEAAVAGNSNNWWSNSYNANAAAASGILTTEVHASRMTAAATAAANTYTANGTHYVSVNGGAWQLDANANVGYQLTATGWVVNANGGTLVNNLDGTVIITPTGFTSHLETVTRTNLSGTPIVCGAAPCKVPGNYPAGSFYTISSYTSSIDEYFIDTRSFDKVTDMTGAQLTALPAPGASFCVQHGPAGAQVFVAINSAPAAGADNYNAFGAWSCSAADIAAATGVGAVAQSTVLLSSKATGFAGVSVGLATVAAMSPAAWLNDSIIAVFNGLVYPGWRMPAGPRSDINDLNKTAVNAELAASGYPTLP